MPGDGVHRLDIAAVALRHPAVKERQRAEAWGQRRAVDGPGPVSAGRHAGGDVNRRVGDDLRRERQPRVAPGRDPAVEHRRSRVAQDIEHPPQARRHCPARVVVRDDPMLSADPEGAERGNEGGRVGEGMAPGASRARQHRVEVHEDRPGEVRLGVGRAPGGRRGQRPADVGDPQVRVVEADAQLGGGDQAHLPSIASADGEDGAPGAPGAHALASGSCAREPAARSLASGPCACGPDAVPCPRPSRPGPSPHSQPSRGSAPRSLPAPRDRAGHHAILRPGAASAARRAPTLRGGRPRSGVAQW